ncbi:MAG: acyl-CoA dehydrogenase family protein [Ectothiorhodospiraceae bacterium]|nr:acyl-CoA dehydrogenase family protein [Ectothiorhodospiraceae bacterium]
MDFAYSQRAQSFKRQVETFMEQYVLPYNAQWHAEVERGAYPLELVNNIKDLAKWDGLWNLFLPGLPDDAPGVGLSNLDYAPVAEAMGRVHWASEVFNCSAPDTGNMELLHLFATPEQRSLWLEPLLDGSLRSCFAMSEPDVASSDARISRPASAVRAMSTSSTGASGSSPGRDTRTAGSRS